MHIHVTGLSLSSELHVALIFTCVTNSYLFDFFVYILVATQITRNSSYMCNFVLVLTVRKKTKQNDLKVLRDSSVKYKLIF